jgi:alpha-L-rhamnosidase
LYRCLAGIRPDAEGAGYKKFVIKPAIIGDLTWVKATYESVYGQISSSWEREGRRLTLAVTVPPNTTAVIYVPTKETGEITESGKPASEAECVRFIIEDDNSALFEVSSGTYRFKSTLPEAKTYIRN